MAALATRGCANVLTPTRAACDLLDRAACEQWMRTHRPDVVIHCAAATGGVAWNAAHGFDAFRDNTLMLLHLVDAARSVGTKHMTHVSTSIAYPSGAQTPFQESMLWSGRPGGPTSGYAHAKRLGEVMLELAGRNDALSSCVVMPANVYGEGARMDPERSNVVAAMVRRFVQAANAQAEQVVCWGTGTPLREFIHVDDVAEGIVRATERISDPSPINIGTGTMCSIKELADMIAKAADWHGDIMWDASKPDGVAEVCCDTTRMEQALQWRPHMPLREGIARMVQWFQSEGANCR